MQVNIAYPKAGPAIVTVRGQLDIDTAPTLRNAFEELALRAAPTVVVDLGGLEFCDSIGLSTFVVANRRTVDQGGWLRLAAPTSFLIRLLRVVGVAEIVPMYRTVEGARRGDPRDLVDHVTDRLVA
jgi:anti-sigma B factor antagonist